MLFHFLSNLFNNNNNTKRNFGCIPQRSSLDHCHISIVTLCCTICLYYVFINLVFKISLPVDPLVISTKIMKKTCAKYSEKNVGHTAFNFPLSQAFLIRTNRWLCDMQYFRLQLLLLIQKLTYPVKS